MRPLRRAALVLAIAATLLPASSITQASELTVNEAVASTLRYVRSNPGAVGVTRADLGDLIVTDAYRSAHSGVTHVYLRQRLNGLEVLGANLTAGVSREGTVFHTGSRLRRDLAASASGLALIDAARAAGLAQTQLNAVPSAPVEAKRVYQVTTDGRARLAWNMEIDEISQEHWWNVSVDAETGELLEVVDYVDHEDDPEGSGAVDGSSYRVYALPLESPNDGDRTLEVDPADPLASPYGWHDLNGVAGAETTTTSGNNVTAHADVHATGVPLLPADGGPGRAFDFPLNLSELPIQYKEAAVTNLFYWNNMVHDVFYGYGFTEAAGNFQENNYGRGGLGSDSVTADGQDSAGVNNANFATPPDSINPRMQMYLWPVGRKLIDGDLDNGVIIHEYGHGISNRLTGGPSNTSCLDNDEQAGEGWSDWLAIAMTARAGDSGLHKRGLGTYVSGQANRQAAGIRPAPYSTSPSVNHATYDAIKGQSVPHGVGWVWASMLWEMYWRLAGAHGFNPDVTGDWTTGGNNLAIQLVMDGMKLQPCSPGFVDSRDAIIAADAVLTGGANKCRLWSAFAVRGLGFSAVQGSSNDITDGSQAFNRHPTCP